MLQLPRRLSVLVLLLWVPFVPFVPFLVARTNAADIVLFVVGNVAEACLRMDDAVVKKGSVLGIFLLVFLFFILACAKEPCQ